MSEYVFTPPQVVGLPIVGREAKFPVRHVYCIGRNYVEHAKEMGFSGREEPFFFSKPADALVMVPAGEQGVIHYPSKTNDLQYEMELVVALGKGGRDIAVEAANHYIFGYALGLDMTRRDLQGACKKQGRPWEVGKAFDESGPIGPIHPVSQTGLLEKGSITLSVNGQIKQNSDLNKLIWSIPESIAFLSGLFELKAGDLIFTGTPEGVGPVGVGDRLLGTFEGLGELDVRVI